MYLCHKTIAKAAQDILEVAQNDGLAPISLAVYDRQGLQSFFIRMPESIKISITLAGQKARTSALMAVSTRQLHARLVEEQLALADFCGEASTSLVGGVPLVYADKVLGGVGVSGRKPVDDEKLALLFVEKFAEYMRKTL